VSPVFTNLCCHWPNLGAHSSLDRFARWRAGLRDYDDVPRHLTVCEVIGLRKQDRDERDKHESLLDTYMHAIETASAPIAEAA
jgi:Uncharacterized protein conserved in bacteria (DUF2312)